MKVVNVAGFDMSFVKDEVLYNVPDDGRLHSIPDKCFYEDNFQGLLRVIVPPSPIKQVVNKMDSKDNIDINDHEVKQEVINKVEKNKKKPLANKRLSPNVREKFKKANSKKGD